MSKRLQWRIVGFLEDRAAKAAGYIARSHLARWLSSNRVFQRVVRILLLSWEYFIERIWWPAKQSIRKVRKYLRRHEVYPWVVTWFICILLGLAIIVATPTKIIAAMVGVLFCALVIWRLEIGIIAVMILTASIILPDVIPRPISLGGQGPRATELLIFLMLVIVFIKSCVMRRFNFFKSPITPPMLFLCMAVLLSMAVSFKYDIEHALWHLSFRGVYNSVRPMFSYLLFFPVAFGIQTPRQLNFILKAMVWTAIMVGLAMIVQHFIGSSGKTLFIGGRDTGSYVFSLTGDLPKEVAGGVVRFAAPGLALILVFFLVTITHVAYTGFRNSVVYAIAAVIMGSGLIFSFTRHFWISTFFSMLIISVLVRPQVRRRLIAFALSAVIVAVIGTVLLGSLAPGTTGKNFAAALGARFASILNPEETFRSSSLQNRFEENRLAIQKIKQHPIFGIGAGNPVKFETYVRPPSGTQSIYPVFFMHNSYLELWMIYGLLGLISFIWLSVVFLVRSFILFKQVKNPAWQSLAIALFACYIGFLERCITQMHIVHDDHHIVTVALMWGIIEAMWLMHNNSKKETAGLPMIEKAEAVLG